MKKRFLFCCPKKSIFPVLFLFAVLFSCKSNAPTTANLDETGGDQSSGPLETVAELPAEVQGNFDLTSEPSVEPDYLRADEQETLPGTGDDYLLPADRKDGAEFPATNPAYDAQGEADETDNAFIQPEVTVLEESSEPRMQTDTQETLPQDYSPPVPAELSVPVPSASPQPAELSQAPESPPAAPQPVVPPQPVPQTTAPLSAIPPQPIPQTAAPQPAVPPQRPEAPRESQPPPVSREPPPPPPFLRPAEPEIISPAREPVPVPINPLPELPGRQRPETVEEQIVFSRVVRVTAGQMIEIPFRGTGWVYLGELGNRRGISYDSRRLDIAGGSSQGYVEGQSFIFRAELPGTYILKFYKQDFIQDYIINDYVQIIVGDDLEYSGQGRFGFPVDRGRVVAEPRWPMDSDLSSGLSSSSLEGGASIAGSQDIALSTGADPFAASPAPETGSSDSETGTVNEMRLPAPPAGIAPAGITPSAEIASVPNATLPNAIIPRQSAIDEGIVPVAPPQAVSSPEPQQGLVPFNASPAEYVRLAQQEFDAGRVESALTILDAMKQRYPSGTDEAWWLFGQLLEANSSSRDVRLALEYYRRLVREYPQSIRAGDAQRRIAYLERFYLNIR